MKNNDHEIKNRIDALFEETPFHLWLVFAPYYPMDFSKVKKIGFDTKVDRAL